MTSTTVRLLHCDFAGCGRTCPDDQADGWTNAIYTHGCPDHGAAIAAHKAKLDDQTRGRGRNEKTTWYLTCACGWYPTPNFQTYNATRLKAAHLTHVREETAGAGTRAG
jgi:hypothetical protein